MSIITFDFDNFKQINDQYGHAVGDHVLKETCALITRSFVRANDLFARTGGEEFVIVLPGTSPLRARSTPADDRAAADAYVVRQLLSPRRAIGSRHQGRRDHDPPRRDPVGATDEPRTKVVVFSQWLRMHEILGGHIAKEGWGHAFFHGSVESRERGKILDRFRDDPECRVFLSTDAGGVGLNLQHASVVINVDLPWNPAVIEQRIGRVHRIGQRDPVRVINFVAEKTIEHGMLSVLRFKKSLFAGVLDGGEKEVFLGKGRLDRFMESVESVAAEIQPAPLAPEIRVDDLDDTAEESAPEPQTTSAEAATLLAEPLARLIESGVGFLHQLAAALPENASGADAPRRRIEPRQDADGSMFLAVPFPSRDALAQIAEGLAALLRSVQR